MQFPFKYKDIHSCEAIVLTCIDFRFWRETLEFIEKELGIKSFDFPSLPGAAKAINDCLSDKDLAMSCITVPCDLHHAKKLVLVNHADCGAYGGSKKFNGDIKAEQRFHEEELKKAKKKIIKMYSDLQIILVYAKLDKKNESIKLIKVE